MEVGEAVGGATLVLPEETVLDARLVRGLSGVDVLRLSYDPSDLRDQVMPEGQPLGSYNDDGETLSYWILTGEGADRWWLARTSDGIVIVPETVTPVPEAGR